MVVGPTASLQYQRDWDSQPGVDPNTPTENDSRRMFYKFNYEWNGDTRAFGSTYQPFVNRDQTPSHGVGWNFVNGSFTHSIRFGYMKFQNHIQDAVLGNPGVFDPAGNIPVDIRIGPAGVVTRFGPSRLAPQATFQGSYQIKYDGSKLSGSHMIRYGVAFNRIRGGGFASFYGLAPEIRTNNDGAAQSAAAAGPFPGGAGNPLNYPVTSMLLGNGQGFFTETPAFGYPAGGQYDNRFALYAGDSWKVKPNFTLEYGLRWSRDTGRSDSDLAPLTCDQIDVAVRALRQLGNRRQYLAGVGVAETPERIEGPLHEPVLAEARL